MRPTNKEGDATVEVYRHTDHFPQDVAQLFLSGEQDNIQLSEFWYRNLADSVYGVHPGVGIFVLRKGGWPVAALPVINTEHTQGNCVESLSNFYTSLYAPAMKPGVQVRDVALLIKAMLEAYKPVRSIRLAPMDPLAPGYPILQVALRACGLMPFRFFCFGNWYLTVTSDWTSYFKSRDGELRNTIRRMSRRFSAEGGTLEIISTHEDLARGLAAYEKVYAASWKREEPHPDFIPGLLQMCVARGWLRLGIAYLRGEPIAAQIWIVANAKADIYKLAFDARYKTYAPGTLLTAMLMRHVINQDGVGEVDYLIGDDRYKKSWMNHRRERWGLVAYNPKSWSGFFDLMHELTWRTLKPWAGRLETLVHGPARDKKEHRPATDPRVQWTFSPASEFPRLSKKWQALCNLGIKSPLLSAHFVETSLHHFGTGDEVICFAETASGPVAATILRRKNALMWETFQPGQMPLGPWLQNPQVKLAELLPSLLRALPLPALMLGVTQLDTQFTPKPYGKSLFTLDAITTGEIDLPESAELFKKSVTSKPFHRRLRKAEQELGQITLTCDTHAASVQDYVNLYASIESRSWKGEIGTALQPDDSQTRFYADLLLRFAASDRARMYTLNIGDRKVAAQIAIVKDDVLYLLKTTYDPDLRHLSPGVMMHYFITLHGYEQATRIKRIEFYGPLNQSQQMWISGTRSIFHINAYRLPVFEKIHRHRIANNAPVTPTL